MTHIMTLWRATWLLLVAALLVTGCGGRDDARETIEEREPDATVGDNQSAAGPDDAMATIEERVSELRGLETLQPTTRAFLTSDELRQRIIEEMQDYTEQDARDDVLLYVALELMEPDVDLHELLIDVQTEQIMGFYDPDTAEMYIVQGSQEFGALQRSVYAHEYTHALQDQHFDLEALGFTDEEEDEDEESDRDLAVRSLVEGDALLLQQQYMFKHFDTDDLQELLSQAYEIDTGILDAAPDIVRESLTFPYEAGLLFVNALYDEGGWSAVDAAYANPPLSSEQILHPERYPDDVPQIVTLPPLTDTLGAGWRLVDEDVAGEFELQLYLEVYLSSSDAAQAADGWDGDRYAVYWREDESAFVLVMHLVWDTPSDAAEFFSAYAQFAEERFGDAAARTEGEARWWWSGDDALLLAQNDQDETLVIIAPDQATLEAVRALWADF